MRGNYTQVYVHCVWATWDRLPLVTEQYEGQIHAAIAEKCRQLRCEPLAVGGIEDHVHVLAQLAVTISIADLIKELKGSSSHLMTHVLQPGVFFRWQGAYGVLSVSTEGIPAVKNYIRKQKEHHASGRLIPEYERWEDQQH